MLKSIVYTVFDALIFIEVVKVRKENVESIWNIRLSVYLGIATKIKNKIIFSIYSLKYILHLCLFWLFCEPIIKKYLQLINFIKTRNILQCWDAIF